MMNIDSDELPQDIVRDIRQNFGFLFDRGYEIVSTRSYPGRYGRSWEVLLSSPDFSLKIVDDDGLSFFFRSLSEGDLSLGALIYFLSGEKEILGASGGMKECANLIGKYIDEIESRYRDDYSGLQKDVESIQKKYEDALVKSVESCLLPVLLIPFIIFAFYIWNDFVFDGLLSGWLVENGLSSSSWLIRGISLVLAAGTTYIFQRAFTRPIDAAKLTVVSTDQKAEKKSAVVTVIRFLIFWVAYVLVLFVLSVYLPISPSFETMVIISEVLIGFLLAAWTVRKIGTR
jgi:hypothetical protein